MARTFADTLTALVAWFPESLVSSDEFDKIVSIGSRFPSLVSMGAAFETRLADPRSSLDFFLAIDSKTRFLISARHLDPCLTSDMTWQKILRLFSRWMDTDSMMNRYISRMFLEFDIGAVVPDIPVPAVFLQLKDQNWMKRQASKWWNSKLKDEKADRWLFDALEIMKNGPISPDTIANVLKCGNCLTDGAWIDHAAIMASRATDLMRINITGLDVDALVQVLSRLELDSRELKLIESLADFAGEVDHLVLALDVGDIFGTRIGVELHFSETELGIDHLSKWSRLLDRLVERGLCLEEKREGLMNWHGRSRLIFDPELYRYQIIRDLNHIKLVFAPEIPPMAKGYFSFIIQPYEA